MVLCLVNESCNSVRYRSTSMPLRCVLAHCSNINDPSKGIGMHKIPFWNDNRPETKRRRKRWIEFIQRTRAKWKPSQYSALCSEHFVPQDFERQFTKLPGMSSYTPRLAKDEIGIITSPSIYPPPKKPDSKERGVGRSSAKRRAHRMVSEHWSS